MLALKRFYFFTRKISQNGKTKGRFNNNQIKGYCLKADIKHYFEEVNHKILIEIIGKKINDEKAIWLIKQIIKANSSIQRERERERVLSNEQKGMPLGNLTSQFFANIYLNELDYFVKHTLKVRYYLRYVDDFIILHNSQAQLIIWKQMIQEFLKQQLKIELHPQKSRIIPLSGGIDFLGFRNFYNFRLLRKKNITKINSKVSQFQNEKLSHQEICKIYQGWQSCAKWANTFKLKKCIAKQIAKIKYKNVRRF